MPLKCLFVFPNAALSSNFSGAASRFLASYLALKGLGVEVHVLRYLKEDLREHVFGFERSEGTEARGNGEGNYWQNVIFSSPISNINWIELVMKTVNRPLDLTFPELHSLKPSIVESIGKLKPDIIWAESAMAAASVLASETKLPWVYSQHDMIHRISQIRQSITPNRVYLSSRVHNLTIKRAQAQIVRQCNAIVTGSQTEAKELQQIGGKNIHLIPTAYNSHAIDLEEVSPKGDVRIIHLGSLRTTANYAGLIAYLDKVQLSLEQELGSRMNGRAKLHIIGDCNGAKENLIEKLENSGSIFHGHIHDLKSILRPFDIAIIPYEHDTGTRTKLPLLFSHAQVILATKAAVAGSPEVQSGENCIVLPTLEEFPATIINLILDPARRERIGRHARRTFDERFILNAQLPKYQKILDQVVTDLES